MVLPPTLAVWIADSPELSHARTHRQVPALAASVSGMIGTQPKLGEGSVFNDFLAVWELQDPANFPGLINGAVDRRAAVFSAQVGSRVCVLRLPGAKKKAGVGGLGSRRFGVCLRLSAIIGTRSPCFCFVIILDLQRGVRLCARDRPSD